MYGLVITSTPSFLIDITREWRMPSSEQLGYFREPMISHVSGRGFRPGSWRYAKGRATNADRVSGLFLLPAVWSGRQEEYDRVCLLDRILNFQTPGWYGSLKVHQAHIPQFGVVDGYNMCCIIIAHCFSEWAFLKQCLLPSLVIQPTPALFKQWSSVLIAGGTLFAQVKVKLC